MPPSLPLRASGLLAAMAIATAALWSPAAVHQLDAYSTTVKLAAGAIATIGSLYLSSAVGGTFLRGGGRRAFKALYWASLASAGAGIAEAASGLFAANVPLAVAMAALSFAGAGLMLLIYPGGG